MTLGDWLRRVPAGDRVRRALDETIADGLHETRAATSSAGRVARIAASVAAVARLCVALAGVFEEGYPMRNVGRDLHYGLRRLRASPAFTLFSILTLALGIGATTAFVSLVRTATEPPPGVRDPERILNLLHFPILSAGGSAQVRALSWADYRDFKTRQTSFDRVMAWQYTRQTLVANGHAETAFGEIVDGDYFPVLGVTPALGRALQPSDDRIGAVPVVVISDRTWQRMFDAARDVIGRTIVVNGTTFDVVGVAPPAFAGVFNGGLVPTAVWLPLSAASVLSGPGHVDYRLDGDRDRRWLLVKGRLKSGRTLAEAQAEATVIARQLDAAYPLGVNLDSRYRMSYLRTRRWTMERLTDASRVENGGQIVPLLATTVLTAVALVLLVACTNLANLALARSSTRRHDVAVRLALGAPRWRLLREALTESLCVVIAGSALAAGLARMIVVVLSGDVDVGGTVLRVDPSLDVMVWVAAVGAALLAFVVAGVLPALQATRVDVRTALMIDGAGTGVPRWRGRRWLITLQVAVSLALIAMATLSASQLRSELNHDTGMALDHMAVAEVDFGLQHYDKARAGEIIAAVTTLLRQQSGIESGAASSGLPLGLTNPGCTVTTPDRPIVPGKFDRPFGAFLASTPSVFQTWGVRIVRGRAFTDRDDATSLPVAIVSEATAKSLFDTMDVVGREIQVQRRRWAGMDDQPILTRTIVGVATDTDTDIGAGAATTHREANVYVPLAQHYESQIVFSARTSGNPSAIVGVLRKTIASVDPTLAIAPVGTAMVVTGASNLFLQVTTGVTGLLGSFALILALAGLYGALSHIVMRRTREMGIRVSLGASSQQLVRMVVADGLRPVVIGIAIGLAIGVVARMALQPIFVNIIPSVDPFVVAIAPVMILIAGTLACYLPARRAAHVDPNVALREL